MLRKKARFVERFTNDPGLEDPDTRKAIDFMNSFYEYDRMRETGPVKGTGARPNMKLAELGKEALDLGKLKEAVTPASVKLDRVVKADAAKKIKVKKRSVPKASVAAAPKSVGDKVGKSIDKGISKAKGLSGRQKGALGVGAALAGAAGAYQLGKRKARKDEGE